VSSIEKPTPETATADLALLHQAADAQLVDGYRKAMAFLDKLDEAGAHIGHLRTARRSLGEAFTQAIANTPQA
jgi:predicted alpha/beta hydrolase